MASKTRRVTEKTPEMLQVVIMVTDGITMCQHEKKSWLVETDFEHGTHTKQKHDDIFPFFFVITCEREKWEFHE